MVDLSSGAGSARARWFGRGPGRWNCTPGESGDSSAPADVSPGACTPGIPRPRAGAPETALRRRGRPSPRAGQGVRMRTLRGSETGAESMFSSGGRSPFGAGQPRGPDPRATGDLGPATAAAPPRLADPLGGDPL